MSHSGAREAPWMALSSAYEALEGRTGAAMNEMISVVRSLVIHFDVLGDAEIVEWDAFLKHYKFVKCGARAMARLMSECECPEDVEAAQDALETYLSHFDVICFKPIV